MKYSRVSILVLSPGKSGLGFCSSFAVVLGWCMPSDDNPEILDFDVPESRSDARWENLHRNVR